MPGIQMPRIGRRTSTAFGSLEEVQTWARQQETTERQILQTLKLLARELTRVVPSASEAATPFVRSDIDDTANGSYAFPNATPLKLTADSHTVEYGSSGGNTTEILLSKAAGALNRAVWEFKTSHATPTRFQITLTGTVAGFAALNVDMDLGTDGFTTNIAGMTNITQGVKEGTTISPTISANQDNWNPTDFNKAITLRVTASGAPRTITGILADGGRRIRIINVGANTLTLANQNGASSAANRIITGTGADVSVVQDQSVDLWYDPTTLRWRIV